MKTIQHEFVEFIPSDLNEGIIYITIPYKTAVHLCICGCKNKVVTRFSPDDWSLIFDGKSVSLFPSIGNWSFECKSHYWIKNNSILRAPSFRDEKKSNERTKKKKKKVLFGKRKGKINHN